MDVINDTSDISLDNYNQLEQKILKIDMEKKFNSLLQDALPLIVILSEKKLLPWFYENYIIICGSKYRNNKLATNSNVFVHDRLFYSNIDFIDSRILDYSFIDFSIVSLISDMIAVVVGKIKSEYYVVAFLDEYYLEDSYYFESNHYKHEYILHGYNMKEKCFYVAAFRNRIFINFTIPFVSFLNAVKSKEGFREDCAWIYNKVIMFMKPIPLAEEYPFHIKVFLKKLKSVIDCTFEETDQFYLSLYQGHDDNKIINYGMNVYHILDNFLCKIIENIGFISDQNYNTVLDSIYDRYKMFHSFLEHRKGLMERFLFIADRFDTTKDYQDNIKNYEELVKGLKPITVKFLKLFVKINQQKRMIQETLIKKVFLELKEILDQARLKEMTLLKDIYNIIEGMIE